jgi:hypothetical protein
VLADALSKIADPTIRSATAMELFGRTGTQLLPMLRDGAEGLRQWQQRARDLNLTESTESVRAAAAFRRALTDTTSVLSQLGSAVGSAVVPILKEKAELVTRIVVRLIDWVNGNKQLIATVFRVASYVGIAGVALVGMGTALTAAGKALSVLSAVGTAAGAALSALASPLGIAAVAAAALAGYLIYASNTAGPAIRYLRNVFSDLKGDATAALDGIRAALSAGSWRLAASILWTGLKLEFQRGLVALSDFWRAGLPPILDVIRGWGDRVVAFTRPVLDWLGTSWGALWDGFKAILARGLDYGVYAFSVVQTVAANFGASMKLALTTVELASVKLWESLKYYATEVTPAALRWLSDNGTAILGQMFSKLFGELVSFMSRAFDFIRQNVPVIIEWIYAKVTGATAKADAIAKALVAVFTQSQGGAGGPPGTGPFGAAARQKTDLEKRLEEEQARGGAAFGADLQRRYEENRRVIADLQAGLQHAGDALNDPSGKLRQQLDELRRRLDEQKMLAEKQDAAKRPASPLDGLREDAAGGLAALMGVKAKIAGTFNAAALFGLGGGGGAAEQTAKNTQDAARTLRRIQERLDRTGDDSVVFTQ